jgi:hypothetical protein
MLRNVEAYFPAQKRRSSRFVYIENEMAIAKYPAFNGGILGAKEKVQFIVALALYATLRLCNRLH